MSFEIGAGTADPVEADKPAKSTILYPDTDEFISRRLELRARNASLRSPLGEVAMGDLIQLILPEPDRPSAA